MKINPFTLAPLTAAFILLGCNQDWPNLSKPGIPPVVPIGVQIASFDDPEDIGECEKQDYCWAGWNVIQSDIVADDAFIFGENNEKVITPARGWLGAQITNWDDSYNGTSLIQTIGQSADRITDALTGELLSPPILIENDYIQLQLAGGHYSILSSEGMTGVILELLPENEDKNYPSTSPAEVIGWASGENSNTLKWKVFDLSKYNDRTRYVRIRVVDANTGGWGQTIVDNVYRSDEKVREYDLINNEMIGSFDLDPIGNSANGWTSTFTSNVVGNTEGNPKIIGQAVNTCIPENNCDSTVGKMTSDPFEISQDYINFVTMGGGENKKVFVKLYLEDSSGEFHEQYSETPTTCGAWNKPYWVHWDVSAFKGQQAKIEIIDNEVESCGFIVVDQIHQSNQAL